MRKTPPSSNSVMAFSLLAAIIRTGTLNGALQMKLQALNLTQKYRYEAFSTRSAEKRPFCIIIVFIEDQQLAVKMEINTA